MFMEELWGLLVDAQSSLGGIPSAFLQDKKQEMIQAKVRADFCACAVCDEATLRPSNLGNVRGITFFGVNTDHGSISSAETSTPL